MPVAEPYKEFAARWGSKEFQQYCKLLEQTADTALQDASKVQSLQQNNPVLSVLNAVTITCLTLSISAAIYAMGRNFMLAHTMTQEEQTAAAEACGKVAAHEQAFWQMAYES